MRTVPVGAQGSFAMVVAPEHLANRFKDATLPAVLATPVMIMALENAALDAIVVGVTLRAEEGSAADEGRDATWLSAIQQVHPG